MLYSFPTQEQNRHGTTSVIGTSTIYLDSYTYITSTFRPANTTPTIIQELRPETGPSITQTTKTCTQQTLPCRYPETPVQSRHLPLIAIPSTSTNIEAYLAVSDNKLESETDSVRSHSIAGPSTFFRKISTSTPSARESSNTGRFD